jgi:superfamily II DNA or RNA helicase
MSRSHELPALDPSDTISPSLVDFADERRDMLTSFDSYVANNKCPDGRIGRLTRLQSETLLKIRDFVAGNQTHGLLELTCGYGKSALATTAADALGVGRLRRDGSRRQAFLSTSRNTIVNQLVGRNVQYTEGLDGDNLEGLLSDFGYFAPHVRASMYNQFAKDLSGDVVVAPYQSLGNLIRTQIITPERFSVHLLDESQHLGRGRQKLLKTFANHGLFIGLSATPGKSREFLPTVIDRVTLPQGILKHKFLADLAMHGLQTGYQFRADGQIHGDYRATDIDPLSKNTERNELIVQHIYDYVSNYGPGLVKCARHMSGSPAQIKVIADMANRDAPYIFRGGKRRQLRVEAVSASIKGSQAIIDEFIHSDTIDALTFVDLVGEGFNMPRAKWGIWTPPTMSHNALEQFIGRGVRLDPDDIEKVFRFLQLIDVDVNDTANVFGWELFDLPRDTKQAMISKTDGVTHSRHRSRDTHPQHQTIIGDVTLHRITHLAFDTMRATQNDQPCMSLTALQEALAVDRGQLKRVLYDGGFTAYPRLIDEVAELTYVATALEYAQRAIATPEDKTIRQIGQQLDMAEANVLKWIHTFELSTSSLYPRGSHLGKRQAYQRQIHMTPEQLASFKQRLHENATPLQPTEITFREACKLAGLTPSSSRMKGLQMRGFTITERKLSVAKKSQTIGLRAELLPWVQAYILARRAPSGFMPLRALTITALEAGTPSFEDVLIAVANLKIRPRLFVRSSSETTDYVEERHRLRLIAEVNRVMQQRARAETDPSVPMPKITACIYGTDPSAVAQTTKAETSDELLAETSTAAKAATQTTKKTNLDVVPIKLQQAIMSRHRAFRNLNPTDETYADQTQNVMRRVVGDVTTPFPPIPREWVFTGDLADELNVSEVALVNLLVTKEISTTHACFIEINGIRGLLGFCSPQLAKHLRNKG